MHSLLIKFVTILFHYYFLVLAGGTNESYNSDDPSIKQCLRKTRGELLLQEYEVSSSMCHIPHVAI